MDIKEVTKQFNTVAKMYDENRRKFIPCFDSFYRDTTEFIAGNISCPSHILDLGAGTGLLTYYWYNCFPNSKFTLVDVAAEMLKIAKQRFAGLPNVKCEICDYSQSLPCGNFDVIISALSIHHLPDGEKSSLFKMVFDRLPTGGLFVNFDQFCAGSELLNKWYDNDWEKFLRAGALSDVDIRAWQERRKLDRECSQESEIESLKACGFKEVKCVFSDKKFAVIIAIK